jgi:hypothetical protein
MAAPPLAHVTPLNGRKSTTSAPAASFGAPSFGFGHLTLDVDLIARGIGLPPLNGSICALSMLAFLLLRIPLAFVCALLAIVCHPVTLSGGVIPFVSDPVSLVGAPLPPRQVALAQFGRLFAPMQVPLAFTRVRIILRDHDSPSIYYRFHRRTRMPDLVV